MIEAADLLIFNADDPVIACLGENLDDSIFFGIDDLNLNINAFPEKRNCPVCKADLRYSIHYLGHLGIYECVCGFKRPETDVKAVDIKDDQFTLIMGQNKDRIKLKNSGIHNIYNALAAACGAMALKIDFNDIVKGLKSFEGVNGRFQEFKIGKRVVVDFAHNPAGVKAIVQTLLLQKPANSKLIVLNTISSESGISGDIEIANILNDVDVIVVASNAGRNALMNIDTASEVILTESSKKDSKIGTLGASREQVKEGLEKAISLADEDDIILVIGEGGVKYSAEIIEKSKN
jgi:UDP-N-acetylmuramyl tripeptide synthase